MTCDEDGWSCSAGHRWPLVHGVGRFVGSEAYSASFGYQWNRFSRSQLDNDQRDESARTFTYKTGLTRENVAGRLILDVGCGMGRFTDIVASWGGRVVGVDLSSAVEAAHENLQRHPDAVVLQADVFALPFAPSTFDLIFSIGVLHHTPDTRAAFQRLPPLLNPGGTIAIWVYATRQPGALTSRAIRRFTRGMQPDSLLALISRVGPALDPWRQRPLIKHVVNMLVPASGHPDPEWRILDTFDWYAPRFQWKHSFAEVEGWFSASGLVDIRRLEMAVAVRGRREG